jgi:hypothetical protein
LAENDVCGIAEHIASRVAQLGGADDVLVSRTVKDLVAGSGIAFEDFGAYTLKGIPECPAGVSRYRLNVLHQLRGSSLFSAGGSAFPRFSLVHRPILQISLEVDGSIVKASSGRIARIKGSSQKGPVSAR